MTAILVEGLERAFDEVLAVQGVDLEVDEGTAGREGGVGRGRERRRRHPPRQAV